MKTLVASLLAVSALVAAAAPAAAQPYGGGRPGYDRDYGYGGGRPGYDRDYGYGGGRTYHPDIKDRIDQGARSGRLTRYEARRLYEELRELDRLEASYRYSGGGLNGRERRDLEVRTARLKAAVWQEKHDWDRRGR